MSGVEEAVKGLLVIVIVVGGIATATTASPENRGIAVIVILSPDKAEGPVLTRPLQPERPHRALAPAAR
jgi:hypothetical protein